LGKLRVLSGREVCKILTQHGRVQVRQRGIHIVMQRKVEHSTVTVTVPVPNYSELRVATFQSVIRQSGLPRSLFEE
jgi:predicted RNA binding protein YcfA (HicA-like mRNA interferase family)